MKLDYIEIGQRLKKIRGKTSLSTFGNHLGYSYSYVRNCENGKKPSLEYLHAIVDFWGLSMNWLMYGAGPMSIRSVEELAETKKIEAISDPDLKRMINVLIYIMSSREKHLRSWAIYQFKNAFREHCAEYDNMEETDDDDS